MIGASLAVVAVVGLVLVVLASRSTSSIPTGYNRVILQATGCPDCLMEVGGETVSLVDGEGVVDVPEEFTSLDLLVRDAAMETGWDAVTEVALLYEGFQPGEIVTDDESRGAASAQGCLTVSKRETVVRFQVVWDRNPPSEDPLSTEYSLRAWASPQIAAGGPFNETSGGILATQNPACGLTP